MDYILSIFREKLKNNNVPLNNNENDKDKKEKKENSEAKSEIKDNEDKEKEKESETNDKKEENENKNNEKEETKLEEINYDDEIFLLLCIILSKNKLIETISAFIETISNKVEKSNIDKDLKENIMKECKEIKKLIKNNIAGII